MIGRRLRLAQGHEHGRHVFALREFGEETLDLGDGGFAASDENGSNFIQVRHGDVVVYLAASSDVASDAVDSLERATQWLLTQKGSEAALAGATPYLRMFGNAAGGCMLADEALAALRIADGEPASRVAIARFFAENVAVQSSALERTVTVYAEQWPAGYLDHAKQLWDHTADDLELPPRARDAK